MRQPLALPAEARVAHTWGAERGACKERHNNLSRHELRISLICWLLFFIWKAVKTELRHSYLVYFERGTYVNAASSPPILPNTSPCHRAPDQCHTSATTSHMHSVQREKTENQTFEATNQP